MATFDFGRLDSSRYCINDPRGVRDFQVMVEDFINIAKVNPDVFNDKIGEIKEFCLIITDGDAWPLAQLVVPEFRVSQNHWVEDGTSPMHIILQSVKHKLPQPLSDSESSSPFRRGHWTDMLPAGLLYAPTRGRGVPPTIFEEPESDQEACQKNIDATCKVDLARASASLTGFLGPHNAEVKPGNHLQSMVTTLTSPTRRPKNVLRRKHSLWYG
ncbi:hypothetical protein PV08_05297 [Exophiala spinifera]|uniref:Uncharacterized protein n=1 Tax=Exophiala spinifera TaxID=91928 RepID=A0A0D1ZR08_9EURO|nr:uncharacterized protein PV08_05297 [Exophiala spinifera]KIW15252.1 hypothetical protein PV08_05297 [Exophiala spinifera]